MRVNLRRLELIVFADNPRAIGLYEKLGFEHEGVMREFGFKRGQYLDAILMGGDCGADGSSVPGRSTLRAECRRSVMHFGHAADTPTSSEVGWVGDWRGNACASRFQPPPV